jgi:adenine deaminase
MYVGVLYRHSNSGEYSIGFIKNLEFKLGAVAQTIAHDTHNIVFAGWSESDIKLAVKRLTELQGGIVVVNKGRVLGELQLKLAGLMSIEEPETVYKKYRAIVDLLREHGSIFEHVFMTLSLISLPVIPEIRITDKGIVDVKAKRTIPLILESDT